MNFRKLKADEIDVRAGTLKYEGNDKNGEVLGGSFLLYKNARVDMTLLDETVGPFNWKRTHEFKDGKLYCTVSLWDDVKKQWVDKEDVGVESFSEAEKGQASDSFKRACFNWGIGRELYTSPFIWITPFTNENLKNTKLIVSEIEYEGENISKLTIIDSKGNVRYSFGGKTTQTKPQEDIQVSKELVDECKQLKIELSKLAIYYKKSVFDLTDDEVKKAIEMKKKTSGVK